MKYSDEIVLKSRQYFVDFSEVFKIQLVDKRLDKSGKEEKYVMYKPQFPALNQETLVFTEPYLGFNAAHKRQLVARAQAKQLLNCLGDELPTDYEFDQNTIDQAIKTSQIEDMMVALRHLWVSKQSETGLSSTKRDMYATILNYIALELSLVFNQKPERITQIIVSQLPSL